MHAGRYQEAEQLLRKQPDTDAVAVRLLQDLADRQGKSAEAEGHARRLMQLYEMGRLQTSEAVGQAAYGAWYLDQWHEANNLFIEASKIGPASPSMFVDWGNLYLEKYSADEAESIFTDAIQAAGSQSGRINADAYAGLARALRDQSKPGSTEALNKALELDPENLSALTFQASLAIEAEDWKEAIEWIDKVLRINKQYLPMVELKCALYYFRDDAERFRKTQQEVLQINPHDADLFEKLGEMAVASRRLEEALEFYGESIKRNPRQWSALASLGINLLRLGQEAEGKRVLEKAYENDPFNIWTVNTLRLVDSFDRFKRSETAHFSIKLEEKEADALRPYVEELLERSLTTLERKYGHDVVGKYQFEMYPDHEDFAVRTLGLPGLGALGATFGKVVAMDSPSARRKDKFHWGSTLWHEVAHVVVLSLSNSKVPRWFTEGLSMMEERQALEGWGEYMTPAFVEAYRAGELLPLTELNSGFTRPKSPLQMENSYYLAGWICEFLAERYGLEKIRALLVSFGQGKNTETAFKEILGASIEEVDQQFRQEMDRVLKPLLPRLDPTLLATLRLGEQDAQSVESLVELAQKNPENYYLNLQAAQKLQTSGRSEEAIPFLEKALQLFPAYAGKGSPHEYLSTIYLERKEKEKALQILRSWWKAAPRFPENAITMANLLLDENQAAADTGDGSAAPRRIQEAIKYLEESMYVDPLVPQAHQMLGDLYLIAGQPPKAAVEFQVLLNLEPTNAAYVHYKLGQAFYEDGKKEEARRQVLLALEIAPDYDLAQKLLLKIVQ